jgi:hypothetical protein
MIEMDTATTLNEDTEMAKNTTPNFRVEGNSRRDARVILLCSDCGADLREITLDEEIHVDRGYYCAEHDDGNVVHLNLPTERKKP